MTDLCHSFVKIVAETVEKSLVEVDGSDEKVLHEPGAEGVNFNVSWMLAGLHRRRH